MRKQTNECPPSVSGRVRKLCVDKLVLDLAAAAFSHILFLIHVLTLKWLKSSVGARFRLVHVEQSS